MQEPSNIEFTSQRFTFAIVPRSNPTSFGWKRSPHAQKSSKLSSLLLLARTRFRPIRL